MASATSSGRPTRPTGVLRANWACAAARWSAGRKSHQGVSTTPGETALTRSGASSTASGRTRDSTAALTAPIPATPGAAIPALAAPMNVIDPSPAQRGQGCLRRGDVRQELDLEACPQGLRVERRERAHSLVTAHRDDEMIEGAQVRVELLQHLALRGIHHRRAHRALDRGGRCVEPRPVASGHDDVRALGHRLSGHGQSDAGAAAHDNQPLIFQAHQATPYRQVLRPQVGAHCQYGPADIM